MISVIPKTYLHDHSSTLAETLLVSASVLSYPSATVTTKPPILQYSVDLEQSHVTYDP